MAGKNLHVVLQRGKWALMNEGSTTVSAEHDSKREAIDAARELAARKGVGLRIHGKTGQTFYSSPLRGRVTDDEVRSAIRKLAAVPVNVTD